MKETLEIISFEYYKGIEDVMKRKVGRLREANLFVDNEMLKIKF